MSSSSTEVPEWLLEAVSTGVPGRGRMVVFTIAFARQMGEEPTIADIAETLGISEAVAERRVLLLLEHGLVAWDENGLRVTLPGIEDTRWD